MYHTKSSTWAVTWLMVYLQMSTHRERAVEPLRHEEAVGVLDAGPDPEPEGWKTVESGDEVLRGGIGEGHRDGL